MISSTTHYLIAEGVETLAQHNMLRGLACQMAQGYLYSKPTRPDEVPEVRHQFGSVGVVVPPQA